MQQNNEREEIPRRGPIISTLLLAVGAGSLNPLAHVAEAHANAPEYVTDIAHIGAIGLAVGSVATLACAFRK